MAATSWQVFRDANHIHQQQKNVSAMRRLVAVQEAPGIRKLQASQMLGAKAVTSWQVFRDAIHMHQQQQNGSAMRNLVFVHEVSCIRRASAARAQVPVATSASEEQCILQ